MKEEIVKFENGQYAVRKKTWVGYKYKAIYNGYWFDLEYIGYCQGTLELIKGIYTNTEDIGAPIEVGK